MKADVFEYEGEGIQCVYDNKKWVVCIKNWKPNNDIEKIQYLEVHHATDEQFILVQGKAVSFDSRPARMMHLRLM